MSWLHRIPIIGDLLDFGGDISYEVKRARLEKLDREEPVEFTDDMLGTFRYKRELNWFELSRPWGDSEVQVTLDGEWKGPDEVSDDAASLAVTMRTFWEDQPNWLARCEECIERDLLQLAKEWAADADVTLTKDQFLERIRPQSIGVSPGGGFDVWFEDGGVFAGHGILVWGTIENGPEYAEIHG